MDEQVRVLSRQMQEMRATLHVFTDYDIVHNASQRELCRLPYPHVELHYFDAHALLQESGYPVLAMSSHWPLGGNSFAQSSDILRVLLARKYRYTYVDFDTYFIETGDAAIYSESFVGAAIVQLSHGE